MGKMWVRIFFHSRAQRQVSMHGELNPMAEHCWPDCVNDPGNAISKIRLSLGWIECQ